uniref:Uncharacterized protein n=1 Tax=Arundo donax TaxID=35708 RepID=A0A0A9GJ22_ARUDO
MNSSRCRYRSGGGWDCPELFRFHASGYCSKLGQAMASVNCRIPSTIYL